MVEIGDTYRTQKTNTLVMVTDAETDGYGASGEDIYGCVVLQVSDHHRPGEFLVLFEEELGIPVSVRIEVNP